MLGLGSGLGKRDDASRRHPYRASSPSRAGHVTVAHSMTNPIDGNWYENECVMPLLTVDPNQNPKTFFWIGFGFGQLTKKRCYRFLGNPKCCQPPIYCDVG